MADDTNNGITDSQSLVVTQSPPPRSSVECSGVSARSVSVRWS